MVVWLHFILLASSSKSSCLQIGCHQWNQSSLCPTVSCLFLMCFASVYTQKAEDMKTGEPLHFGKPGNLPPPAEGDMAQAERTGAPAEFPLKQTGLVSLPCSYFTAFQPPKPEVQLFICLQVIPASCSYPSICRHACLRLQMNPFIFT